MDRDDHAYFIRRAEQERRCAATATRAETRLIHAELADRYDQLVRIEPASRPSGNGSRGTSGTHR